MGKEQNNRLDDMAMGVGFFSKPGAVLQGNVVFYKLT